MFRKWLLSYKWRKLRLRVWEKRLNQQLQLISRRLSLTIHCSLHVSWGPFYGGSVIIDRKYKKTKIFIQIPFDYYVTEDERQVLARYQITTKALPYIIFFHECFHLIDALSYLQHNDEKNLNSYQAALKATAAQKAMNYRNLHVEQCADDFAYRQYLDLCEKAG